MTDVVARRVGVPEDIARGLRSVPSPDDVRRTLRGPCRIVCGDRVVAIVARYEHDTATTAAAVETLTCPAVARSASLTVNTRVWGRVPTSGEWSRATTMERDYPDAAATLRDYATRAAALYRAVAPREWAVQESRVRRYRLAPTAPWTTGSVNRASATAYHRDSLNTARTWSGMLVLRGDGVAGGELVLPEYALALDLHDGDVLLFAGAETWHGNLPLRVPSGSWRYSLPLYAMDV